MKLLVKDNADFISLLLNTTFIQAQALLDTATKEQVQVLTQIARNLLQIPLESEAKEVVEKNTKILKRLADTDKSLRKRAALIGTHRKKLITILKANKKILMALVDRFSKNELLETESADEKS